MGRAAWGNAGSLAISQRALRRALYVSAAFCCFCGWIYVYRPAEVPWSAARVGDVYIYCRADDAKRVDVCTIYRADNGETIVGGVFRPDVFQPLWPGNFIEQRRLRYAAYSNWAISLRDGTHLIPTLDTIGRNLANPRLNSATSAQVVNCTKSNEPAECAINTRNERKPFYVTFAWRGVDAGGFEEFAGDKNGRLFKVDYESDGASQRSVRPEGWFVTKNLAVQPCPEPMLLYRALPYGLGCELWLNFYMPPWPAWRGSGEQTPYEKRWGSTRRSKQTWRGAEAKL